MSRNYESLMSVPLFEQMVATLKGGGRFNAQLGAPEFKTLTDQLMSAMLDSPEFRALGIRLKSEPVTSVEMRPGDIGALYGRVGIASPIGADIQLWADFANGGQPHEIVLAKCQTQISGGIPARLLSSKIDGGVKKALAAPNRAIFTAMREVVTPQGIDLTDISLHFAEQKLQLGLGGKPISK